MLIGFKTSPQGVDWPTLESAWAAARSLDVFDSAWMNDHLSHPHEERHGPIFEAFTVLAALAHHLPGKWLGHLVLSNTFRHPSVLAKQATAMDHITHGRFVLGLGAGWHEGEHDSFGIELPPVRERFDRFESALRVIRALFAPEAAEPPGVDLDAPPYALHQATNEPPPLTPGGPRIWVGVGKPRGFALAARYADGWNYVGDSVEEFTERRDGVLQACESIGRDPASLTTSVQTEAGGNARERREAVERALAFARAGCDHLIFRAPTELGAAALETLAREVAEPLRERLRT